MSETKHDKFNQAFDAIRWGTKEEKEGLQNFAALVIPPSCDNKYVNTDINHEARELITALLCAFVFKNKKKFVAKNLHKPIIEELFYWFINKFTTSTCLDKESKIIYTDSDINTPEKFIKTCNYLGEYQLPETYWIYNYNNERFYITYNEIIEAYDNIITVGNMGRVHRYFGYIFTKCANNNDGWPRHILYLINTILRYMSPCIVITAVQKKEE